MYKPTFHSATQEENTHPSASELTDANNFTNVEDTDAAMDLDLDYLGKGILYTYGTDSYEQAALYAAISGTDEDIINMRFLFQFFDVDPDYQEPTIGVTALHCAAQKKHLAVVKFLLRECGARIDIEDKENRLALDWAMIVPDQETRTWMVNEFLCVARLENPENYIRRKRIESLSQRLSVYRP